MPRKKLNLHAESETRQPDNDGRNAVPKEEPTLAAALLEWKAQGIQVRHFDMGKDPMSDAERQFRFYLTQPKIPFYIPLGWGEKQGMRQWFQANDLAMWIDKGRMVNLPKPIADSLLESLKMSEEASNPFVIDGDGRVVRAQSGIAAKELSK